MVLRARSARPSVSEPGEEAPRGSAAWSRRTESPSINSPFSIIESPSLTRPRPASPSRGVTAIAGPVPRVSAREGIGVILLASVLFGTMALFVRLAAREMPPVQITFVRFVGSFVILMTMTRGRGLVARRGTARPLVVRGLIGAAAISLYFVGIAGAGAGLATLLQNSYPVFAASFAALVLGEAFSGKLVAALALNLVGIGLVLGPEA